MFDRYYIASAKQTALAIRQLEEARAENSQRAENSHDFGHDLPENVSTAEKTVN